MFLPEYYKAFKVSSSRGAHSGTDIVATTHPTGFGQTAKRYVRLFTCMLFGR